MRDVQSARGYALCARHTCSVYIFQSSPPLATLEGVFMSLKSFLEGEFHVLYSVSSVLLSIVSSIVFFRALQAPIKPMYDDKCMMKVS